MASRSKWREHFIGASHQQLPVLRQVAFDGFVIVRLAQPISRRMCGSRGRAMCRYAVFRLPLWDMLKMDCKHRSWFQLLVWFSKGSASNQTLPASY